jgi:drug/metabolite transporter (DMT)-like permease
MTGMHSGELAAVATAFLWTLSTMAWTSAGRRIGSLSVCFHRLMITCVMLAAYGGLVRERWLPTDADGRTWLLLGLSGLLGFFLSDLCAFEALLLIGPRLTLLFFTLSPPIAAAISWGFLGEALNARHWLAMLVTLAGITWVVLERSEAETAARPPRRWTIGLVLAIAAAVSQAAGMVLSRNGIGQYDAVAATFIRVLGALPGYLLLVSVLARWNLIFTSLRQFQAMGIVVAGSVVGPFLGVVLCMVALRHSPAGVVATIVSTMPVLVLPFTILVYRERVSLRAVAGAVISVIGVALMCLGDA